jgi:hypothetical protein
VQHVVVVGAFRPCDKSFAQWVGYEHSSVVNSFPLFTVSSITVSIIVTLVQLLYSRSVRFQPCSSPCNNWFTHLGTRASTLVKNTAYIGTIHITGELSNTKAKCSIIHPICLGALSYPTNPAPPMYTAGAPPPTYTAGPTPPAYTPPAGYSGFPAASTYIPLFPIMAPPAG